MTKVVQRNANLLFTIRATPLSCSTQTLVLRSDVLLSKPRGEAVYDNYVIRRNDGYRATIVLSTSNPGACSTLFFTRTVVKLPDLATFKPRVMAESLAPEAN